MGASLSRGCDFSRISELPNDIREDRISGLPDDIILNFLSPMGMKEAARTSILSKRWRYLWAKRTHLDFDPDHLDFDDDHMDLDFIETAQKDKYINWVNQVLGLHCHPSIDTFRIFFRFYSSDTHHFDRWVKFALSKKVKNLELYSHSAYDPYTLGFDILKPSVGVGVSGITSLTSLHLDTVDVTGDFVEFLLSKCRHLERLHLERSEILVRLKVTGLSLKLKHLTIHDCLNLEELEIDDVNLTHFNYYCWRPGTNLVLKSMPMLVEATFRGDCIKSPVSIFRRISHLAAHLCKLTLNADGRYIFYEFPGAVSFPIFCNLKHLNMVITSLTPGGHITCLLEACPVLHELKLELVWFQPSSLHEADVLVKMDQRNSNGLEFGLDNESRLIERNTHPKLKRLELVGYMGCYNDVNIILSIMGYACNLETIIIFLSLYGQALEISRARAYKLKKIIPPKISVIVKCSRPRIPFYLTASNNIYV